MRLLVTGDREWDSREFLYATLDRIHAERTVTQLIHGAARGADALADEWAKSRGIPRRPFPADWDRYKKAAGPIRNRQMLKEARPEFVAAFHSNIEESRGTKDMLIIAEKAGVPSQLFTGPDAPRRRAKVQRPVPRQPEIRVKRRKDVAES